MVIELSGLDERQEIPMAAILRQPRLPVIRKSRGLAAASSRDNTPLHKAADAHLHLMTLALRAAFNVARKALKGSLRAAGDVEGHEFHGNQWTSGAASFSVDAKVPATQREKVKNALKFVEKEHPEYLDKIHVFVAPTGKGNTQNPYGYTKRNIKTENGKPVRDAKGDLVHTGKYTVYISSKQQGTADFVRTISHEFEHVAQWERGEAPHESGAVVVGGKTSSKFKGLAAHPDISACISTLHAALLKVLPPVLLKTLIAGGEASVAALSRMRAAGDVEGHEFHGNQWTAGGGDGGGVTERPDGLPIIQHPVSGSLAERRGIKVGARVRYHYRAPGMDMGADGSGKVVGFVSNKGRDKGSIQDVVIRDGDSIKFVAEKNVRGRLRTAEELRTLKPATVTPITGKLTMKFDAKNARAAAWAREHAAELAQGIADTTEQAIKDAVARAQEEGGLREQYDDVLAAVGDEDRAQLIARTESMAAANEGNRQGWAQAVEEGLLTGDERREWIATSDACPECEELDGETTDLDGEYPNDGGDGPPLHPNCRCTEGIAS